MNSHVENVVAGLLFAAAPFTWLRALFDPDPGGGGQSDLIGMSKYVAFGLPIGSPRRSTAFRHCIARYCPSLSRKFCSSGEGGKGA
jgi:hypothetical protein